MSYQYSWGMRGIILAGGSGTRLHPITQGVSKQMLPVYDKPMIYYPLSILMMAGIREVLVISTPDDLPGFQRLLGDGSRIGIEISYAEQPSPDGLAQAFLIGEEFIGSEKVCLVLGDNIFYGTGLGTALKANSEVQGGHIFAYHVTNPQEYGVVEFDKNGLAISIEEKPSKPKSNYAVPGLYFLDPSAIGYCQELVVSSRGELEIVDLLNKYLADEKLNVVQLTRGTAWLDLGNPRSLLDASEFIKSLQTRQGLLIGSPEETAWRMGYVGSSTVSIPVNIQNEYSEMLKDLRDD